MRRGLLLLLVLTTLMTGCSHAARTSGSAMKHGDRLLEQGRYAEAVDAFIVASSETSSGPVHDAALRKAAIAVSSQVATQPLPAQVSAMKRLLDRSREPFLPLYAHNWLCERLDANARLAVTRARTAAAANASAIASAGTSPSTSATRTTAATDMPRLELASYAEYKLVARTMPALGQPPEARTLYEALAELRAAMDACTKARSLGDDPTNGAIETLREADARLVRAIERVNALLSAKP